ncbi:MAG: hypothetical protein ACPG3X_00175 [Opitutales bacterium]
MDVDHYRELIPLIVLGTLFFTVAVSVLYWSSKRGHLRNFDDQAKTIFTDEEPEGQISDAFPDK